MPTTVVRIRSNRFAAIAGRLPGAVREVVMETAHDVESVIKRDMAEPKTGELYGSHRASAPGESPAMDTGTLAGSIQVEPTGATSAAVATNMDYAAHLEYGTVNMAARPAWVPAAEEVRPRFIRRLQGLEGRLG
jgi:phage gpG-like protein